MTTINLHQEQRDKMISGAGRVNSALVFSLVAFLILGAIWGVLKLGIAIFEKRNAQLVTQINLANETLNEKKNVDDVVDLQFRLKEIKNNLANKNEVNDVLDRVSKAVIPGISFSSYVNTDKKVLITMRTANFDNVSKQIFSFKKADFVSSVDIKGLSRDEKGVKCDIEMNIK